MADTRFQLDLILDATRWVAGSRESIVALQRLSSVAKQAGKDMDVFASSQLAAAQQAIKSGEATEREIQQFHRVQRELSKVTALSGPSHNLEKGKGVVPARKQSGIFGISLDKEEKNIKLIQNRLKGLGADLSGTIGQQKFKSPFAAWQADLSKLRIEARQLRELFDPSNDPFRASGKLGGIGSAIGNIQEFNTRGFFGVSAKVQGQDLKDLRKLVTQLRTEVKAAGKDFSGPALSKGMAELISIQNRLSASTSISKEKVDQLKASVIKIVANIVSMGAAAGKTNEEMQRLGLSSFFKQFTEESAQSLERQIALFERMRKLSPTRIPSFGLSGETPDFAKMQKFEKIFDQGQILRGSLKANKDLSKIFSSANTSMLDALHTAARFENFFKDFGNLAKSTDQPIGDIRRQLFGMSHAMGLNLKAGASYADIYQAMNKRMKQYVQETGEAEKVQKALARANINTAKATANLNELTEIAIGKLIRYRVAFFLMSHAVFALKDAVKTFREVQNELAEIEKVIEPVAGQMEFLKREAFSLAKEFGESIQNVLGVMKVFAQQGKSLNEIVSLTKTTLIAAAGAGLTTEQAVEGLTAAIKAYNIPAESALNIIDKLANVQADFAVSAQDLSDAIALVASSASAVGLTLDEFLGQVTAIGEVTRKTGKAVALSLKTIFARVERPEAITQFRKLGIEIQNTDGSIRPLGRVLDELALKWNTLSDSQRFNIAQVAAGVHRYSDFLVLMEEYDQALLATKSSLEAQGEATQNTQIELKTLDRQIASVKAVLAEAFEGIASAGLVQAVGGLLELSRKFAEVINLLPGMQTMVATLVNLGAALFAAKVATVAFGVAQSFVSRTLGEVLNTNALLTASLIKLGNARRAQLVQEAVSVASVGERLRLQWALITQDNALIASTLKRIIAERLKKGEIDKATASVLEEAIATRILTGAEVGATGATLTFGAAIRGLQAAFFGLVGTPAGLIFLLVTGLTYLGSKWFESRVQAQAFSTSVLEQAKNAMQLVNVEKTLLGRLESGLDINKKLTEVYRGQHTEAERLVLERIALEKVAQDLIKIEPRFSQALDGQTSSILDNAKALEILIQRRKELADLEDTQKKLASTTENAAQVVRKESQVMSKALDGILSRASLSEDTPLAEQFKKEMDALREFARSEVSDRVGKNAVKFIGVNPSDVESEQRQLAERANIVYEQVLNKGGRLIAKKYSKLLRHELEKGFDSEIKPAILAMGPELKVLKKDAEEIIGSVNFDAFEKETQKKIARSIGEEIPEALSKTINPLEAFRKNLFELGTTAADALADMKQMKDMETIFEATGIPLDILNELLKKTGISAINSQEKFEALNRVLTNTSTIGANSSIIFDDLDISIDRLGTRLSAAEESLRAYNDAFIGLEQAHNRLIELSPEEFIQEMGLLTKEVAISTEEAQQIIKKAFEDNGQDFDKFRQRMDEGFFRGTQAEKDLKTFFEISRGRTGQTFTGTQLARALLEIESEFNEETEESTRATKTFARILEFLGVRIQKARKDFTEINFEMREFKAFMKELEATNKRVTDSIDGVFQTLNTLSDKTALDETGLQELISIRKSLNLKTVEARAREAIAAKHQRKTEEEITKFMEEHATLAQQAREDAQRDVDIENKALQAAFDRERAAHDILRIDKETLAFAEKRLKAEGDILDVAIKLFNARADLFGIGSAEQERRENEARIAFIKRQMELTGRLLTLNQANVDSIRINEDALRKLIDGILVEGSDAEKAAIFSLFAGLGFDIERVRGKIKDLGEELSKLEFQRILLEATSKQEFLNKAIEEEIKTLDRVFDIEDKILQKRIEIVGLSSGAGQKAALGLRVVQLNEELKVLKEQVTQGDAILGEAFDLVLAYRSQGFSLADIKDKLIEHLGISEEMAEILTIENQKIRENREEYAKLNDEITFADAVKDIENFNDKLSLSVTFFQRVNELVGEFKDQSVVFQKESGASLVRDAEAQVTQLILQKRHGEDRLKQLREEMITQEHLKASLQEGSTEQEQLIRAIAQATAEYEEQLVAIEGINLGIEEVKISIAVAQVRASLLFKDAIKESERLRTIVEGMSGSIVDAFRNIPNTITEQFQTIFDLELEIRNKQQEIIDAEADLDPLSADFERSVSALEKIKKEERDLQEQLKNERDLVRQIGEGFVNIANSVGNIILDVQADVLRDKFTEVFSSMFRDEEQARANSIQQALKDAYKSIEIQKALTDPVVLGFQQGSENLAATLSSFIPPSLTGGSLSQGTLPSFSSPGGGAGARTKPSEVAISGPSPFGAMMLKNSKSQEKSASKMFEAGEALLSFAATIIGTTAGGGGQFANVGATAGSVLGIVNPALGVIGSIAGGLIGGLFDKKPEIPKLEDAVRDNTQAVSLNTQELREMRQQFINAPARFTVPPFATLGGAIPAASLGATDSSGSVVAAGGGIVIHQNFNGNVSPDRVKEATKQAIKEAYTEDLRRFGRRAGR